MFYESPRFPDYLAYGLVEGPAFSSTVIQVKSGAESRNQQWSQELHTFDGSTTGRKQSERDEITSFFRTMAGRINGFRIKDYADFQDGGAGLLRATTIANVYQLIKRYTSGSQTYNRDITKPISPIVLSGGGSYTVDYTTGLVTVVSGAIPTAWTGQFDVPARFDHDDLKWDLVTRAGGGIIYQAQQLRIVELRIVTP